MKRQSQPDKWSPDGGIGVTIRRSLLVNFLLYRWSERVSRWSQTRSRPAWSALHVGSAPCADEPAEGNAEPQLKTPPRHSNHPGCSGPIVDRPGGYTPPGPDHQRSKLVNDDPVPVQDFFRYQYSGVRFRRALIGVTPPRFLAISGSVTSSGCQMTGSCSAR